MDRLMAIEERLRAMEGEDTFDPIRASEMCLVPDVVIPRKFKVPDFPKYTGTQCPMTHLRVYCSKMAEVVHDEKLLIHFFHESLGGSALSWYMRLEGSKIKRWKDLADAFLKQYKFNMEVAPNRSDLQGMEKRPKETIKEYAQRWREVAAQIHPPLPEYELISIFSNTFKAPYFEYLIGNVSTNFTDIVIVAEKVEQAIKAGKIFDSAEKKGGSGNKETNEEIHQVRIGGSNQRNHKNHGSHHQRLSFTHYTPSLTNTMSQTYPSNQPNSSHIPHQTYQVNQFPQATMHFQNPPTHSQNYKKEFEQLPPLPISLGEMFEHLVSTGLITPIPTRPKLPPYPVWYQQDESCEYHSDAAGHNIGNCPAFKKRLLALIKKGRINLDSFSSTHDASMDQLSSHTVDNTWNEEMA